LEISRESLERNPRIGSRRFLKDRKVEEEVMKSEMGVACSFKFQNIPFSV
jgi:hypothetical protein